MKEHSENRYKTSRLAAGLTQERAAELLGVSVRMLSDYECGRARPPDNAVLSMTRAYGDLALGHEHLRDSELGREVLPDLRLPRSGGCLTVQAWNAKDSLRRVAAKLRRLFRGKFCPGELCEDGMARLAKKAGFVGRVHEEVAGIHMYMRQAAMPAPHARKSGPKPFNC